MSDVERIGASARHEMIGRVALGIAALAVFALLERGVRALEQLARLKALELTPDPAPVPELAPAPAPRAFARNGRKPASSERLEIERHELRQDETPRPADTRE